VLRVSSGNGFYEDLHEVGNLFPAGTFNRCGRNERGEQERAMTLNVETKGNVSIVSLDGKVTIDDGDRQIRHAMRTLIENDRIRVLFSLDKVPYMDSAGLAALITSYKLALAAGGSLKLLNPTPKVLELLRLTQLDGYFETYREEREALAAFQASVPAA
jgi:anti-anti-sigma factor